MHLVEGRTDVPSVLSACSAFFVHSRQEAAFVVFQLIGVTSAQGVPWDCAEAPVSRDRGAPALSECPSCGLCWTELWLSEIPARQGRHSGCALVPHSPGVRLAGVTLALPQPLLYKGSLGK